MKKKLFFTTIIAVLFLVGCGKSTPTNTEQQKVQPPSVEDTNDNTAEKSPVTTTQDSTSKTSDAIDYNQYVKKVWVIKNGIDNGAYENPSFCISQIKNGKVTGYFLAHSLSFPSHYSYLPNKISSFGSLTGTINKDTAECQFNDIDGNKGNIKLTFKSKDEIEATIKFTYKSPIYKDLVVDGTSKFIPYKLNYMKGFNPFKDQSFTVNLNSWGNVKFVSGNVTGGNHTPTLFYLTDKDGNIIYEFDSALPYSVDVKAVSFQDVDKDGLKDIVIIVTDAYYVPNGSGAPIATVYFQKTNGSFEIDGKLNQEINNSGNNKDVKTVVDYISNKF